MRLAELLAKWHIFAIQSDMRAGASGVAAGPPPCRCRRVAKLVTGLAIFGLIRYAHHAPRVPAGAFLPKPTGWHVPDASEPQSPLSKAAAWAAEVTTIAMEMAVPGLAGWWLDRKLDTSPLCLSVGGGIGLALGLLHLVRFSSRKGGDKSSGPDGGGRGDRHADGT